MSASSRRVGPTRNTHDDRIGDESTSTPAPHHLIPFPWRMAYSSSAIFNRVQLAQCASARLQQRLKILGMIAGFLESAPFLQWMQLLEAIITVLSLTLTARISRWPLRHLPWVTTEPDMIYSLYAIFIVIRPDLLVQLFTHQW